MPLLTPGRTLILLANLTQAIGAFVADYSHTHILNPRWPPHAKFHNGQTMSLSALLAATSIWLALRPALTNTVPSKDPERDVVEARAAAVHAGVVGSLYCLAGLTAILYPGTLWMDPEFGEGGPQVYVFFVIVAMNYFGAWLEVRRLGSGKGKVA